MNYEIGAKTAWFDNRLFFNSTLFYIDIDDMHVWSTPSPNVWVASNAAKAHSQGIEIETRARPLQGLDITAAVGLIQAEFDDYENASIDYSGKTLMQTPAYTLNLAVQYRHATGIFVRGEMLGYGKTYFDEANTISRDPYELYNARIGYESTNWDVYLYGKNLFDQEYFRAIHLFNGSALYRVGEPRKIGIIVSVRF
jgi:iron complex outermembrane receptor protein